MVKPGQTISRLFLTNKVDVLTAPDDLPEAAMYINGALDESVTVTVANIDVGIYSATCRVPVNLKLDDHVQILALYDFTAATKGQIIFDDCYSLSANELGQMDLGMFKGAPAKNALTVLA